jgi:hypothetical protein
MKVPLKRENVIIYGLIDPRTTQLRYVGKSKDGLKRPRAHWKHNRTRETRDHTHNWVRNVLEAGFKPEIEILQEWDGTEDWKIWLNDTEVFYIGYFRMIGANLTNKADGGGGCTGLKFPNRPKPTEEVKKRISQTLTGRKLSPEQCAAISEGQRTNRVYPEHYTWGHKIAAALKGKKQSPELIVKRAKANTGKKRTPEQIERLRQGQLNPETKARKSASQKQAWEKLKLSGWVSPLKGRKGNSNAVYRGWETRRKNVRS